MNTVEVNSSTAAELAAKLSSRTAKLGIVGMGYVGLPLALMLSEQGFAVTGFDVDERKTKTLTEGGTYILSITPESIARARQAGFAATCDYSLVDEMDAVIICVPTPLNENREPDMSYITATAKAMAPHIRAGQLIVLESTTYPGTTEEVLVPLLEHGSGLRCAKNGTTPEECFFVAFSPERENPGDTSIKRRDIPKVVGGMSLQATELASAMYGAIFRRVVRVSTPAVAEMAKLLENIYRCVNIAMVNELKMLCMRMGIDIWEVIDAASSKPFGFQAFYPGPGLGGHCIPIDPFYLSWRARQYDFQTRFIELAGEVNTDMPYHVVRSIASALNSKKKALNGSHVLVLGVAYKKDVDDLRESPALKVIELLQKEGAEVRYHDPYFAEIGTGRHYDLQMKSVPLDNLSRYDCVVIVTDHSCIDYQEIVERTKLVVDTRNATKGIKSPKIVRC